MLFHGTSVEAVNKIVEAGWSPVEVGAGGGGGGRRMLFGQGVYLSSLPGVSLMYGDGLLLCRVILGRQSTSTSTSSDHKSQNRAAL